MTQSIEPRTPVEQAREAAPVGSMKDLIAHFERGQKPRERFRIGLEHEKIGVAVDQAFGKASSGPASVRPLPFEDADGKPQIRALFAEMMRLGWQPIEEGGIVIALRRDGASV